ncbi:MAG: MSMEG_6728 family protein [Pseudonocardiaceae bacterium]
MSTVGVVQTFLPYLGFAASAVALERRRLGKQRVGALQILRALTRERYGWKHYPPVRMWTGYEEALACYAMEICAEWVRRGHADSRAASIDADLTAAGLPAPWSRSELAAELPPPLWPWLGDERLHRNHHAALVRKDPIHYRDLFDDVEDDVAYFWPARG